MTLGDFFLANFFQSGLSHAFCFILNAEIVCLEGWITKNPHHVWLERRYRSRPSTWLWSQIIGHVLYMMPRRTLMRGEDVEAHIGATSDVALAALNEIDVYS